MLSNGQERRFVANCGIMPILLALALQQAMNMIGSWDEIDEVKFEPESQAVARLLSRHGLGAAARQAISAAAAQLVLHARKNAKPQGVAESFLDEFSLGTAEGMALMCLAEALLRIPDARTRDLLIAEKITAADWASHLGQSDSLLVNASTWGLMLTGRLVDLDKNEHQNLPSALHRLAARLGEPMVRRAITGAMQIMAHQFVMGPSISEALQRARREGWTCSFDMLGEAARTDADAARYHDAYGAAIETAGKANRNAGPEAGHGISIKLSALSPRYEAVQERRVWGELYPRLKVLAVAAARYDLNLAIDAEEADRLVLSLKLVERLSQEAELGDWGGLGVVVQAYQKRAIPVIERLAQLASERNRRIMIRLVKGAYWDSEIKAAQVGGMPGYPVFTTKAATDLSYLACANTILEAGGWLYPQFATHNAHTLAAVRHMAAHRGVEIEHQRLHGMGEALYAAAAAQYGPLRVRTYAPVGGHEELLPYLVRRLLENGANSSFVHRLLDDTVPPADLAADPITAAEAHPRQHGHIPLPRDIYGADRRNSDGRDWAQLHSRTQAARDLAALAASPLSAAPIIAGRSHPGPSRPVFSPADRGRIIGQVVEATGADIEMAVAAAQPAQRLWNDAGGSARARVLRQMGDALEKNGNRLLALLVLEAGKTWPDATAEWREAIDFCRYYAMLAEQQLQGPTRLPGPAGERNSWRLTGRGIFACISPWNFPLSIFTGQIAAALAAGNAAMAKPAEQTPLIAAEAVRLFHAAGLDPGLLSLLPGVGAVIGAGLVEHPAIRGVAFTGGTETAWTINRTIAAREGPIIPFIAETGGLNAMFVDTTALREQVIDDVILSAFGSAGQRCSALRMLFLPEETADAIIEGLMGALATRMVGDPALSETDIGPVIDDAAQRALDQHMLRLSRHAQILSRHPTADKNGHYFGPVIAEVQEPDFLEKEVFGPILHICRYKRGDLESYAARLAARGYGLTLGIHTRLEQFAARVQSLVPAGNTYICRSMIGAVVGVQPFGGTGMSGTGPKAGGPQSLLRYSDERSLSINLMAQGGDPALLNLPSF